MPLTSPAPLENPGSPPLRWAGWLALLAAACTLVLIGVGGLVTNTDSGLACPDWPTCFGTPFPKLVGGVLMEHGHRYIGTLVGFLCVVLVGGVLRAQGQARVAWVSLLGSMPLVLGASSWAAIAQHRTGSAPALAFVLAALGGALGVWALVAARGTGRLAQAALLLVIAQGLFGGLTVVLKLPVTVLVLHLGTSMVVMAVLLWLGLRLLDESGAAAGVVVPTLERRLLVAVSALLYLQLVLGAAVRHTGAGLICTDLPFCRGAIWPVNVHPAVHLHMVHRALGLALAPLLIWLSVRLWAALRRTRVRGGVRLALQALPLLVLAQVALGFLTVWSLKELVTVTGHLVVGALIFASLVTLLVRLRGRDEEEAPDRELQRSASWNHSS